jgi:hypothetical protein
MPNYELTSNKITLNNGTPSAKQEILQIMLEDISGQSAPVKEPSKKVTRFQILKKSSPYDVHP